MVKFFFKLPKVNFLGEECDIEVGSYMNGRTSIRLVCDTGEPMATATVNLPDEDIPEGQVAIKDYAENKGIADVLAHAGVISPLPVRVVQAGYVEIPIYLLNNIVS